jgi:DNA-binding NarL/FixJ family response regulator
MSEQGEAIDEALSGAIRIAIADRRCLFAQALAALLEGMPRFVVTGVHVSHQSHATVVAEKPHVVLVAFGAQDAEWLDFIRSLRLLAPELKVVVVAEALEPGLVRFVLDYGLSGLLMSDTAAGGLGSCLDQVVRGQAVLPAGWQSVLTDVGQDPVRALSQRQLEVLELLADGYSYEQIAARLFISVNTVKFHVRAIFSHLGVHNRMAAARVLGRHAAGSAAPTAVG